MNRKILTRIGLLLVAGGGSIACVAFLQPPKPTVITWSDPEGFPPMRIPEDNPFTEEGIALGRRLFYDPILSADSSMSCATCHLPELGFTDGKAVSEGVVGLEGRRSAMSLANVGYYYSGLFWDGRVPTLEEQALHPIRDPLEMAFTWNDAAARVRKSPVYVDWFRGAFGIHRRSEIDSILIGKALAQFQRTLISKDARFDQVQRGEATFTESEKRGWTIFFDASPKMAVSECNHCHVDPLFTDLTYQNNGIQHVKQLEDFPDPGYGAITKNRYDHGKFRVPTLRNIARTAPYMHDGRFKTLEAVLDHYASGGHPAENLNPNVHRLTLSPQDRADVLAFLNTLTDTVFLQKEAFQNPWNTPIKVKR